MKPPKALSEAKHFSKDELEYLSKNYKKKFVAQLAKELGRSVSSVGAKLRSIGLKKRRQWTEEEDRRLKMLWITPLGIEALSRRLDRSPNRICRRARELGLPPTMPSGYEYVTNAAERCGYSASALVRILRWASVPIYTARSHRLRGSQAEKRSAHHRKYVDPFDVDEAVAAWVKTTTAQTLATDNGLDGGTLRRRLRAAGKLPRKGETVTASDFRLDPEEVQQIVEQTKADMTALRAKVSANKNVNKKKKNGKAGANARSAKRR
jgi:hypothetical protein